MDIFDKCANQVLSNVFSATTLPSECFYFVFKTVTNPLKIDCLFCLSDITQVYIDHCCLADKVKSQSMATDTLL